MKSRLASAALLATWVDHSLKDQLIMSKRLAADLSELHSQMEELAKKSTSNPEDAARLRNYANNIQGRSLVFRDIGSGGILAACDRLTTILAKH